MSASELDSLLDLITTQVREIKAISASRDITLISINDLDPTPGLTLDPGVARAADILAAAARRLVATVTNPATTILGVAAEMYGSSLLNVAVEANITEALREAGAQGLHVRDLAPKVGMDPGKLGRVLRYLCAMRNIYREVSPDVFANNRLSLTLDTGKPFAEVRDRNPLRYSGTKCAASIVGHTTDEVLKGAAILSDVLLDPVTAFSADPTKSATMKATGFDGTFWEWIELPEQKKRFHRFGEAMRNIGSFYPTEFILGQYPWHTVSKGGVVVDVGGALGGTTLPLAKAFPDLRFIIQDRAPVIADAERHWQTNFPEAISSGLVKLQPHNFFELQPVKEAAIYILRFILHDWPNAEAIKILEQLRPVLGPNSKIMLLEQIVPYTCPVEDKTLTGEIPAVLNGNLPTAGGTIYLTDIQMMNGFNSQERTIGEWETLVKAAGLKIESINPGPLSGIVCVLA